MLTRLYWAARILGYLACLGGIFYWLAHRQEAEPRATGLAFVYGGFLAFFVSYALRAWLRYGPRRKTEAGPTR